MSNVSERTGAGLRVPAQRMAEGETVVRGRVAPYVWALTRVMLGFVFLWAFLDKLFGWGKATPAAKAWIHGGSPTTGFLKGVEGPFAGFFNGFAGQAWADWLFMIGLAGIGIALVIGVGMRAAALFGSILLVMMWMASLPITTNPFIDDHLVYAVVLIGLAASYAGDTFGLGRWWAGTSLVKRAPYLR
jgi:thiosulfate dehydrogenase [quinone] large subunit